MLKNKQKLITSVLHHEFPLYLAVTVAVVVVLTALFYPARE